MPTELLQRGSISEGESEMLPQDPPPWFIRSLAWLLIALFGVALLAAVLALRTQEFRQPKRLRLLLPEQQLLLHQSPSQGGL